MLRVTSGNKISRKNTGLYILEKKWDYDKHQVNRKHPPHWSQLNDALDALCKEAEGIKADIIEDRALVTPTSVMRKVFATRDFYKTTQDKIDTFDAEHHGSTDGYRKMMARLREFSPTLSIEEITPEFLNDFKTHLKTKGKGKDAKGNWQGYAHNTVVETLTKMKAVLNSVELKGGNPFDRITVGGYKAAKVKELDMEGIQKIRTYIPRGKWEALAKDALLFSFYAAACAAPMCCSSAGWTSRAIGSYMTNRRRPTPIAQSCPSQSTRLHGTSSRITPGRRQSSSTC